MLGSTRHDGAIIQPVTVDQAVHDNLNANANLQVGDVDVDAANPVPINDAGGSMTVDQPTHDNLNANANLQVGDADVNAANPVPVEEIVRAAVSWTTLMTETFDNVTTSANSTEHDISSESALWVQIYVESTLAPTNVRVLPQFEDDANLWSDFEEGLFASLFWEDTDTASGVRKIFLLPCGGLDNVRFNVVAIGTDANNLFDVTIKVREFHGNFGVAHA